MSVEIQSLDPRINRLGLHTHEPGSPDTLPPHDHWGTYQVFHQKKRGDRHTAVGIVHAPGAELAMAYAKEQFGRFLCTANVAHFCKQSLPASFQLMKLRLNFFDAIGGGFHF